MKLYIETLGCPKNFNDSEGIAGIWERSGMNMTDDPAQADAILVNTCGFINDAKKESIDKIFEMADFIEEEDDQAAAEETDAEKKILIVSGCLSQRYGSELFDEMPEVDIVLGNKEKTEIHAQRRVRRLRHTIDRRKRTVAEQNESLLGIYGTPSRQEDIKSNPQKHRHQQILSGYRSLF